MIASMNVVRTHNLSKSYGARRGISEVTLSIDEGDIYGFLGPNGAGKSTTIRCLLGFLRAGHGTATIFGQDCWSRSHQIKSDVGYVAGDVRLYPWLTAQKAFELVGSIRKRDLTANGCDLARRFRLEPDLPVRKMSRGNRQKLALVLALVHRPKLVILDEPTSGLDPLIQDVLADCLREMASDGHTVFFSSHTISEVENLCDRVAIIRDGSIVVDERISDLKAQSPRTVTLRLSQGISTDSIDWPQYVQVRREFRNECELEIDGPAVEFARWAASQAITDLTIGAPSLEALFRDYYRDDAARADNDTAVETAATENRQGGAT